MSDNKMFRLGLLVNPMAGLGGPAGLKGSDHPNTLALAAARGVESKVSARVIEVLSGFKSRQIPLMIITATGSMGELQSSAFSKDFCIKAVYQTPEKTTAEDTVQAAKQIIDQTVDLLLFVGGDGTARDVCSAVGDRQAVLGLPAGVKMHSGVFAVTPRAVVSVVESLVSGKLVAARMAEVRDIDEQAFRQGKVNTRYFGEMLIPDDQALVQCVKCSGMIDDELMLDELTAFMLEELDHDALYILGSGGTLKSLKLAMGIAEPTLLGVDVWFQGQTIARDAYEAQLFELLDQYPSVRIVLSIIGGQGVVLGRGNQQISARIIEKVGIERIQLIATQHKILALGGRPLCVDSGSDDLDRKLSGYHKIISGYDDALLYEVRYSG